MPFSYGKFLAKISSARSGSRDAAQGGKPDAGVAGAGARLTPAEADTAAAESLRAQAVHLPDLHGPAQALQAELASTERVERILSSLWSMTDDLARIRAEFQPGGEETGQVKVEKAIAPGDQGLDERAGVIAQVDIIEGTICRIVAVLAEPEGYSGESAGPQAFIRRVDDQRQEMLAKTSEALRQLRLQAIQLSAAVHAYRSSLALARRAIEQARS